MDESRVFSSSSQGGVAPPRRPTSESLAPPYAETIEADYAGEPDGDSLLDYWRVVYRQKGIVLFCTVLGCTLGLLISLPQTPVYQSQALIEIQGFNENFLNMRDLNPTIAGSGIISVSDIPTQIRILQSRALIERVARKLNLDDRPEFVHGTTRLSAWRKALGLLLSHDLSARERAVGTAADNFTVSVGGESRILEIRSESIDPQIAADFANTLVEEFIQLNAEARWDAAQRMETWLDRQLEDIRTKLGKSEATLQRYARTHGLMLTSQQENVAEEKLRQLQTELSRAQAERITKQSRYELASSSPSTTLPEVLDHSPLHQYEITSTDLRRQLAELSSIYTPAHYKVRGVQAQIRELEEAARRESTNITERITNEYETALRRERLLAADYRQQSKLVAELAGKSIQYNILKREVQTNRQLYDNLLQKVKEAGVAAAVSTGNIRVVDAARPPKAPFKPRHAVNSIMGMLCGAFFGLIFVFVREKTDQTLKRPGDSTRYLKVSELGVIPAAASGMNWPKPRKEKWSVKLRIMPGRPATLIFRRRKPTSSSRGHSSGDVELLSWNHKPSRLAENFRATLTSVLFAPQKGDQPRVLVVTSPMPEEGKTTLASNLAILLAEMGRRVLVLDGDMRKPRLHDIFDTPNQWGLSSLLQSADSISAGRLEPVIQKTEIPGLYLLPSGPQPPTVSNLLHSDRACELFEHLRREFDTVVVDTPPMMEISDARILGSLADAVILVLRAGSTTRSVAQGATDRLSNDGTRLLGTVLNSWDPKTNPSYHYANGDCHYHLQEVNTGRLHNPIRNRQSWSVETLGLRSKCAP